MCIFPEVMRAEGGDESPFPPSRERDRIGLGQDGTGDGDGTSDTHVLTCCREVAY